MADSGNPEDLVSQVVVTGTEESLAKLNTYADGGAAAFGKLDAAAKASAGGVAAASATIDASAKVAGAAIAGIGGAGIAGALKNLPDVFKSVGAAVKDLTDKFQPLTQAIGRFSQRFAIAGAGAVAAGAGLAKTASGVAKAADGTSDALKNQNDVLQKNIDATLKSDERSINHAHSVRELTDQLIQGKISYSDYGNQLVALDNQERESIRVQNQMEYAQERAKEATDRLNKSLKDKEAYQALIDKFGGPLTQSLISFGHQVDQLHKQFLDSFGPGVSQLIDLISNTLTKNAQAINGFFTEAGAKLSDFFVKNGPGIQQLIENIGAGVSKVFLGVLDALPGVIDFFNNVLVPAIQRAAASFNFLADVINSVFGTRLTGGSIVLIAILAQVTGSIRLLFTLLRSFGAILSGVIGVVEALGVGLAEAFGAKKVADIIRMGAAVSKGKGIFGALGSAIRIVIPLITLLATTIAEGLGIALGPAYILLLLFAAALVYIATKIDWKAVGKALIQFAKDTGAWFKKLIDGGGQLVTDIKTKFGQLNAYLSSLGSSIGGLFSAGWEAIKQGASDAAQWVQDKWQATVDWFSDLGSKISGAVSSGWDTAKKLGAEAAQYIQDKWNQLVDWFKGLGASISEKVSTAWENAKSLGADAAQWVQDKWTGLVDWFKSLPELLAGVWQSIKDAIVNAFQTAVDQVKGFFSDLLAKAKEFLQPIIDLLNAIASLSSSAGDGGDSGGTVKAATGGFISGPGGPTGDKIPALLSDGEYVIKARSVAKYGRSVMSAINSGRFSIPGFAAGGFVTARPAFASGGEVPSAAAMRPLNLSLFGQEFPLLAPDDVGERLTKFAVSRQNKSAGRKPAWVGSSR